MGFPLQESSTAEKLSVKLSDFGHSRLMNDGSSVPGTLVAAIGMRLGSLVVHRKRVVLNLPIKSGGLTSLLNWLGIRIATFWILDL